MIEQIMEGNSFLYNFLLYPILSYSKHVKHVEWKYLQYTNETNKKTGPYSEMNNENNLNVLGICYECSLDMMKICLLLYIASILINHIKNQPWIYWNVILVSYAFLVVFKQSWMQLRKCNFSLRPSVLRDHALHRTQLPARHHKPQSGFFYEGNRFQY